MKKQIMWIVIGMGTALVIWVLFYYFKNRVSLDAAINQQCIREQKKEAMADNLLPGYLEKDQSYTGLYGYYECNPPRHGDIALYRFGQSFAPVLKVVRGVPGDKFELSQDTKNGGWNLHVNGDLVKTVEGEPYFFGANSPTTLHLKTQNGVGQLQNDEVIIMSTRPPGYQDSAMFGVISRTDLVGRAMPEGSTGGPSSGGTATPPAAAAAPTGQPEATPAAPAVEATPAADEKKPSTAQKKTGAKGAKGEKKKAKPSK